MPYVIDASLVIQLCLLKIQQSFLPYIQSRGRTAGWGVPRDHHRPHARGQALDFELERGAPAHLREHGVRVPAQPVHARDDVVRLDLSWKVRYRILLWFFSQTIKLYRARSLLYRGQLLQENIRWKLLTRSTRFTCFCTAQTSIFEKMFVKKCHVFWFFCKIHFFENCVLLKCWWNFVEISPII